MFSNFFWRREAERCIPHRGKFCVMNREERGEHVERRGERWTETGHILNSLSMKERSVGGVPVRHRGG